MSIEEVEDGRELTGVASSPGAGSGAGPPQGEAETGRSGQGGGAASGYVAWSAWPDCVQDMGSRWMVSLAVRRCEATASCQVDIYASRENADDLTGTYLEYPS
jgi:hypothetical protein